MKLKLFVALLFFTGLSQAQDFEITGKVTDTSGAPLGSATVYLEKVTDSSLVTYTISEDNGSFVLDGKSNDKELNLIVSYAGYSPYFKKVQPKDQDLGNLKMNISSNELDEVTLTAARAPVSIKSDTLEFNAASFKTREDANLEEVLKKLPGVSVDNAGNITVNGKPVSRILVNGKEFFGDDPKIATKNLPKELINKIQVVDTKTKSQEFTGEEGDSENKTINITIDEDKNRGYFSRLTAGGGTDDRYELSAIANYFQDKQRVSFLASSNNINSSGFTFDEVFDSMGRNAYSISTNSNGSFAINGVSYGNMGGGISETDNIGLNYVDEWAKKTELGLNYFYNHGDNTNRTKIERENILPDGRFFINSNSSSNRLSDNHRFSTSFETQPDTLTRISFRPNFNVTNAQSYSDSYTESLAEDGTMLNNATTTNDSKVFNTDFSNRAYFTRKYGSRGGFYSVNLANNNTNRIQKDYFYSERETFNENGDLTNSQIQDQFIDEDRKSNQYTAELRGRLPISDNWNFDMSLYYDDETSKNQRLVYNASGEEAYDDLDANLSNDFRSEISNFRPSAGVNYNTDTLRFTLTAGLHHTNLRNTDLFSETRINNTYNNLYTNAFLYYKLSKSKSIYFNYSNSRQTPSIDQLQPVSITVNPLNILTGNPSLDPSFNHRAYMNFNNYDYASRSGYYTYFGANYQKDAIVPITFTDENLVRTTTYTNVDGTYSIYGGGNLNKSIELDSLSSLKVNPGVYLNYNKNLGFSNEVQYESKILRVTPNVGLVYDIKDLLTLEPVYRMTINRADYSLNNRQENYLNHELNFQVTSYWPENFLLGSDFSYQKFGNIPPGFKNSFLLWNASLGYKLLGDDGILKLKVFDILNENTSTRRMAGEDFIQNTEELVLKQYFMLSFTWKLKKFGGKDPNNRRGPF
ncbi:TonB-dependent receptor [Christiangramia flava]|uniref:TonB-dependent receptor n=1 Tax=Christiangramia flava TaxID=1486245 RepID=UPI0009FB56D8|nr:TonB-dependent receptor [Christiangramia flava]